MRNKIIKSIIFSVLILIMFLGANVFASEKIVKESTCDSEGKVKGYTTYKYNEDGLLILESKYGSGFFDFLGSYSYKYNEENLLIKKTVFDAQRKPKYYNVYQYNEENKLVKDIEYNSTGEMWEYTAYEYEKGKLRAKTKYNPSDKLKYKYVYIYDKFGRVVKEQFYDKNNELYNYTTYEYDFRDNVTKSMNYLRFGLITFYSEYEYNDAGDKIVSETVYNEEGNIKTKLVYEYNEDKLVKKLKYKNEILLKYIIYEYNSENNE